MCVIEEPRYYFAHGRKPKKNGNIRTICSPSPWTKTTAARGVPTANQVFVKISWPSSAVIHSSFDVGLTFDICLLLLFTGEMRGELVGLLVEGMMKKVETMALFIQGSF